MLSYQMAIDRIDGWTLFKTEIIMNRKQDNTKYNQRKWSSTLCVYFGLTFVKEVMNTHYITLIFDKQWKNEHVELTLEIS